MFFARYLPPELATDLPARVPANLVPPPLVLTPEQEFFAGGFLNGYAGLPDSAPTARSRSRPGVEQLVANRRSKETHSLDHPCAYVDLISTKNSSWPASARRATTGATSASPRGGTAEGSP